MREIKFRAWHKILKAMLETDQWHHYGPKITGGVLSSDDHVIMQYTGLKDKNGKEIYEDDLLKDYHGDIRKIEFIDGGFWCVFPNGERHMPSEPYREVIGNIYETPELLK